MVMFTNTVTFVGAFRVSKWPTATMGMLCGGFGAGLEADPHKKPDPSPTKKTKPTIARTKTCLPPALIPPLANDFPPHSTSTYAVKKGSAQSRSESMLELGPVSREYKSSKADGHTMKPEIYSCLKMLESLRRTSLELINTEAWDGADELLNQYNLIVRRLGAHLDSQQKEYIPSVVRGQDWAILRSLYSATGVIIAYLRSLDSSLAKELEAKERELTRKEEELERLRKILTKAVEAVSQVPEARRSGWVAEMKKAHREIEEHSRQEVPEETGKGKGSV